VACFPAVAAAKNSVLAQRDPAISGVGREGGHHRQGSAVRSRFVGRRRGIGARGRSGIDKIRNPSLRLCLAAARVNGTLSPLPEPPLEAAHYEARCHVSRFSGCSTRWSWAPAGGRCDRVCRARRRVVGHAGMLGCRPVPTTRPGAEPGCSRRRQTYSILSHVAWSCQATRFGHSVACCVRIKSLETTDDATRIDRAGVYGDHDRVVPECATVLTGASELRGLCDHRHSATRR